MKGLCDCGGLDPAERGRAAVLRDQLKKLDEEDDQIIRGTQRFKLERELYDLERKGRAAFEGDAADEWPDVIGGKGGGE